MKKFHLCRGHRTLDAKWDVIVHKLWLKQANGNSGMVLLLHLTLTYTNAIWFMQKIPKKISNKTTWTNLAQSLNLKWQSSARLLRIKLKTTCSCSILSCCGFVPKGAKRSFECWNVSTYGWMEILKKFNRNLSPPQNYGSRHRRRLNVGRNINVGGDNTSSEVDVCDLNNLQKSMKTPKHVY